MTAQASSRHVTTTRLNGEGMKQLTNDGVKTYKGEDFPLLESRGECHCDVGKLGSPPDIPHSVSCGFRFATIELKNGKRKRILASHLLTK